MAAEEVSVRVLGGSSSRRPSAVHRALGAFSRLLCCKRRPSDAVEARAASIKVTVEERRAGLEVGETLLGEGATATVWLARWSRGSEHLDVAAKVGASSPARSCAHAA